jgi:hypothetical protein
MLTSSTSGAPADTGSPGAARSRTAWAGTPLDTSA